MGEVGVGSIGINIAVVGVAGLVMVSFGMCDVCIAGMGVAGVGVAIGDLGGHVVGIHPPSIVRTWQHYSKKIKGHIPK